MRAPTRKDTAEAYRLAVIHGIVEPRRAVDWADRLVARDPEVAPWLLDLASAWSRPVGDVLSALGAVPGQAEPTAVLRLFLVLVDEMLTRDPGRAEEIARMLFRVAVYEDDSDEAFRHDAFAIDDAFDLARRGVVGTLSEARAEVIRVVRTHRADDIG